ncbi:MULTISPECIES: hypothetical protein [unclassified Luteimonas]
MSHQARNGSHRPGLTVIGLLALCLVHGGCAAPPQASDAPTDVAQWRAPGQAWHLAEDTRWTNPAGAHEMYLQGGGIDAGQHPFFVPGPGNGRACVTCHQPTDAMSLSADSARARWEATRGTDPLFAVFDGANCPSASPGQRASHSLLLERGLFRTPMPWPPRARDGRQIEPEFDIEVVHDPAGCNLDPIYGLHSPTPTVSVFRRPRVAANLRYITRPGSPINLKNGHAMDTDPDTGLPVTMNLMADARHPTVKLQAIDASLTHHQSPHAPAGEALEQILDFLARVHVAQAEDHVAGDLTAGGSSPIFGARAMADAQVGVLGDNLDRPVFGPLEQWGDDAHRASVARGHELFMLRPFWIRDVTYLNSIGLGNPVKRTCTTCHNHTMTGMDLAPGWMDIGVANQPWADPNDDLPLFRLTCRADANPHPYLGRSVLTSDPGRALVTGRCVDIGSINIQQMRGLAARAPYFSNGSARTVEDVVRFYDRRFEIGLSEADVEDMANFLRTL